MSKLKDIMFGTARKRRELPSRAYSAMVWKNWRGYSRWNKTNLIEQAYQRNPAYYAACNIIAQTIADMPVYAEYEKNGKTIKTAKDPILSALERGGSREELIEKVVLYLLVTGESYMHALFSEDKRLLGFVNLPSQYMTPVQGDMYKPISHYEFYNKGKEVFGIDEIISILKPDLEGPFKGMSPGVPLAELIDLNNAGITWNKNVAVNGGLPPVVATADGSMDESEAQEIKDWWKQQSGADKSHELKIAANGLKLENLSTTPHDAEWVEAILSSMRMIFMAFGLSSSLMNDAANKTYNNVKDSRKALYTDACIPIAHRIYRAISRFCSPYYKHRPEIKVDESNIEALQEDKNTQADRLAKLVDSAIMTRNDARKELGLPLSGDELADKLIISNKPAPAKRPEEGVVAGQQNGV